MRLSKPVNIYISREEERAKQYLKKFRRQDMSCLPDHTTRRELQFSDMQSELPVAGGFCVDAFPAIPLCGVNTCGRTGISGRKATSWSQNMTCNRRKMVKESDNPKTAGAVGGWMVGLRGSAVSGHGGRVGKCSRLLLPVLIAAACFRHPKLNPEPETPKTQNLHSEVSPPLLQPESRTPLKICVWSAANPTPC